MDAKQPVRLVLSLSLLLTALPQPLGGSASTASHLHHLEPLFQSPLPIPDPLGSSLNNSPFQSPLPTPDLPGLPLFQSSLPTPEPSADTGRGMTIPPSLPLLPVETVPVKPGQKVHLAQGRLAFVTPPDIAAGCVRLEITHLRPLAEGEAGLAFTFDLTAAGQDGKSLERFVTPITITLRLGDLVNWSSCPDWLRPWLGHWDEEKGEWVAITPIALDEAAGVVTFVTDHLSNFGARSREGMTSGWLLHFKNVRIDRLVGAGGRQRTTGLPGGG